MARDFRTIEAKDRFLSAPDTRGRIADIIAGILRDIKQTGRRSRPWPCAFWLEGFAFRGPGSGVRG